MPSLKLRVLLAAAAFAPLAAVGGLEAFGLVESDWIWPTLVAAGTISLGAVLFSVRIVYDHMRRRNGSFRLFHPRELRVLAQDLPSISAQRARLDAILAEPPVVATPFPGEPETLAAAMRRTVLRILKAWDIEDRAALSDDELAEISLLLDMVTADPGDAGRIAMAGLKPERLLAIRDELNEIDQRRRRFERQRDTFEATRAIWHMRHGRSCALRDSLERLALPDVDLWHHVVVGHDPLDRRQRDAALWCVLQSSCDKATVAVWLTRVLTQGHAIDAAMRKDLGFVWSVEKVINLWNAGWYSTRELGLTPPEQVAVQKDAVNAALERLSALLGDPRWPTPHGLFDLYQGRSPQSRSNWCLVTGTVTRPPRFEDYVEGAA